MDKIFCEWKHYKIIKAFYILKKLLFLSNFNTGWLIKRTASDESIGKQFK